jgi:hydrogenase-4 component B
MPSSLIILAIILSAASGLPALVLPRRGSWAQRVSVGILALACGLGLAGAGMGLFETSSTTLILPWPSVGDSLIGLDPLSAFFLVPIFLVGGLASIYSLGYWPQAKNPRTTRRLLFFYGLLVAGMALLVIARQALAFLIGWEAMALSAFFLVTAEDEKLECRRAGLIYLVATHVGTLILFGMFALWRSATGSFELTPVTADLGLGAMNAVFFLCLLGFGLKAGIMPLHFWLPGAHANAPSHVSAVMSGVMLKMGIYGILRMLSLMPSLPAVWGVLVLALGVVSGVLGVAFAIAQHDMKKLLAYHSVENIGIILIGLGVAMLGRSCGRPELLMLGICGCLLHVWNHAFFKSLLFMGAGSVVRATGTRAIDRLGGLAKSMPWTAAFFLIGAVAICGLPPMNGFVSELLIYLGLFGGVTGGGKGLALAAVAAPCLALIGALAVACFVKVCGAVFLGNPREADAEGARESPVPMLAPMAALAASCAFIGLAPALVAPVLERAAGTWAGAGAGLPPGSSGELPSLLSLVPLPIVGAVSLALLAATALVTLALAIRFARRGSKTSSSRERTAGLSDSCRSGPTWDCGYAAPTARMQYTASSFARGIVGLFAWALRPEAEPGRLTGAFPAKASLHGEVQDVVLDRALAPAFRRVVGLSRLLRRFQQGLTQHYVLYILIALVALLATLVPFDSIIALVIAN